MNKINVALILFIIILQAGCQSVPPKKQDPSLTKENSSEVVVYRPSSDFMGMAINFKVTVDDEYIGSLNTGRYITRLVNEGKHFIKVRPYFMGIPEGKGIEIELNTEKSKVYYLRFTQHISSAVPLTTGTVVTGGYRLSVVEESSWESRK